MQYVTTTRLDLSQRRDRAKGASKCSVLIGEGRMSQAGRIIEFQFHYRPRSHGLKDVRMNWASTEPIGRGPQHEETLLNNRPAAYDIN